MLRGLRIVAQYADGWNQTGDPSTFPEKRDALLRHCEEVGRDPAEIEISAQAFLRDGDHATMLRTASTFVEQGADHVDPDHAGADGPDGLRLLAERVAEPLRSRFG